MARVLARAFAAPLICSTVSRLLVDLNRSPGHPQVYSAFTRAAPAAVRARIAAEHYLPYRAAVEHQVRRLAARGLRVVHVASHSFTPVLGGRVREAEVGLLYDPARGAEAALCARWKAALGACAPQLRVRRNYPYAGKGDGLTSVLRSRHPQRAYLGIELEFNQALFFAGGAGWNALRRTLVRSLRDTLRQPGDR